jgi:hypothetical protein
MSGLNFDIFQAPEIRDLLKTKAHLLRAGLSADHVVIETFSQIVAVYRRRVGLETFLSQMLGEIATTPIQDCQLYRASGEPVDTHGAHGQPVQRFIARGFSDRSLLAGLRVVAGGQERYL